MFGQLGRKEKKALKEEVKSLRAQMQHFLNFDPASGTFGGEMATFRGTTYPGDLHMIAAVNEAYNGESNWGANITKTVLEIRAAMIGGAGIDVVLSEGYKKKGGDDSSTGTKELEFARRFIRYNNIDSSRQINWAVEGGIDGRALSVLTAERKDGETKVFMKYIPFTIGDSVGVYNIKSNPEDFTKIESVSINQSGTRNLETTPRNVPEDRIVYKKFGGRISDQNRSSPLVGHVMAQIEAIDKSMRDLREMNYLFSQPTPVVVVENASEAEAQYDFMTKTLNWKIGKLLVVGGGDYKMVGPDMAGTESIKDEIVVALKVISGVTGVPPHFLGFTDLMANRATADGVTESLFAATAKERNAWISFYTENIRKAMVLYNKRTGDDLDPEAVTAALPENAQTRLRQIVDVWLPLFQGKGITRKTLLRYVPNVDSNREDKAVRKDMEDGAFDGIKPVPEGSSTQLGRNKPGSANPDPDDTASKTRLEKRTTGAGRNAR